MTATKGRSGGDRTQHKVSAMHRGRPPKKPKGLSKQAAKYWDEITALIPDNVLAPIDAYELTILANLLAHSDELAALIESNPADASSRRLYLQTFKEIHRLSSVFGLNPADRARLGLVDAEQPDDDPIAEFFEKLHGPRNQ